MPWALRGSAEHGRCIWSFTFNRCVRTYQLARSCTYVHSESPINSYMHVTTVTAVTAKLKVQNIVTAVAQNQSAYTGATPKKLSTSRSGAFEFSGFGMKYQQVKWSAGTTPRSMRFEALGPSNHCLPLPHNRNSRHAAQGLCPCTERSDAKHSALERRMFPAHT